MSEKKVYSSKVEAAYIEEDIFRSKDGTMRNMIFSTPFLIALTAFCVYMAITEENGFFIFMGVCLGLLTLILSFVSVLGISNHIKLHIKDAENIKKRLAQSIDGDFYNKCVEAGYTDINKRSDIEKIYNLAKSEGYTETKEEIIEVYKKAAVLLAEMEAEQKIADKKSKLQSLMEAEAEREKENRKYINLKGIEKPIAMIDSEIAMLKQSISRQESEIRKINNGASSYYHLNKQHEANWATHGGIASAIGGPVAGAAVAADVAQRSAEAKANNQRLRETATTMASTLNSRSYSSISDSGRRIDELQKKKKDLQMLLVEELPESKLLKYISPTVVSQSVSETGAVIVNVTTQKSPDFLIYDDTHAVVDGSVKVLLMNGNDVAGTAFFSLPFSGSTEIARATVVCREVKGNVTEIKFEPYHLWAIEKTKEDKPKTTTDKKGPTPAASIKPERNTPLTAEGCKNAIVRSMEPGKLYSITDIKECCPEVSDLTHQRVSALVRQLIPTRIERYEENTKAYFRLK